MPATLPQLILASQSRYRAELLRKLGLQFSAEPADVDETPAADESPVELCQRLALAKATAIRLRQADPTKDALIIGSDQVACLKEAGGITILGKPGDSANARAQLRLLSGEQVSFFTSLCLLRVRDGFVQQGLDETKVYFRDLTDAQIREYVDREQPLDCAGAFKSEALGIALFERLETQDPNALIGLPLIQLCSMLAKAGLPVLGRDSGW